MPAVLGFRPATYVVIIRPHLMVLGSSSATAPVGGVPVNITILQPSAIWGATVKVEIQGVFTPIRE